MSAVQAKKPNGEVVELTVLDVAWIVQSLATQRNVLTRSRNKEITGGEVWILRGRELDAIGAVLTKLS